MIKLIVFDLDGVLIDSKNLHYYSLNSALNSLDPKYVINREEHLSIFDGLNTRKKLEILSQTKNLPKNKHDYIWKKKQEATFQLIKEFSINERIVNIFQELKKQNYLIAVASNSIRETVKLSLLKIGVLEYTDFYISSEDVMYPKPYPEMYWACMKTFKTIPTETIIIEDSHIGRKAAINSGANLLAIKNPKDLTLEKILNKIKTLRNEEIIVPWKDNQLNILIPMAGAGSRFLQKGYTFPKPLIEINSKPMIEVVVNNLNIDANYIFVLQKEHYEQYNLKYMLNLIAPNCKIIQTDGITEGAACTTLLAKEYINNDSPLLIANSDQYINWNSNECMYSFTDDNIDGGILTFNSTHPKWSYVSLDNNGFVSEVAEKKVISNIASVGIYYWKHGKDYVKYAEQMIERNIRVNNEFYVCPVFNQAIEDNKKIKIKNVDKMWGIGTPEDLDVFLKDHKDV